MIGGVAIIMFCGEKSPILNVTKSVTSRMGHPLD